MWRAELFLPRAQAVLAAVAAGLALSAATAGAAAQTPPNLVVIITDDVGYGDIGPYGATQVQTPALDRMADEGLLFTEGYAPAATCTPTRYSFMTGQYAWRSAAGSSILSGVSGLAIDPAQPTIASLLKDAGYATAFVGKWHLGLGTTPTNYNGSIQPGYPELGFDYAFAIPATGDRVPTVYVENSTVLGLLPSDPIQVSFSNDAISDTPLGSEPSVFNGQLKVKPDSMQDHHAGSVINGISRIGYMSGGHAARWVDEDMADVLVERALGFIEAHQAEPFFLYYATHDIHVPRWPHPRFQGTTACGIRCDAIAQMDYQVGEILQKLDALGLSKNTLVVFSSDNGPVLGDGYQDRAALDLNGHDPAGVLSGGKYSILEGGTRVPFITRWPGVIKPGSSSAIVSLVDLFASAAALSGKGRASEAGPDSFNVLEALLGLTPSSTRDHIVTQTNGQNQQAVRVGDWKYIPGNPPRLFNLAEDPGEQTNVAAANPDKVAELSARLDTIRDQGSSRPEDDGYVFAPLPDPGQGGGGAAGAAGTAGALGTGGAAAAGSPSVGGASSASGGVSGGGASAAGSGTPGAVPAASDAGCGCRLPPQRGAAPQAGLVLLLGLLAWRRRVCLSGLSLLSLALFSNCSSNETSSGAGTSGNPGSGGDGGGSVAGSSAQSGGAAGSVAGATSAPGGAGGSSAGVGGAGAGGGPVSETRKPNFVFILADDMGYGDLGAFGQQDIQTPRLDSMAAEGLKFTDFYSSSTVCAPARTQLLTGLHSGHAVVRDNQEVGMYQFALPAETLTLGEVLKAGGYQTGAVGKWGMGGPATTGAPNVQGFDFFYGYLGQVQAHSYYPDHLWRNETQEPLDPGTYSHDLITEEALAFIERNQDQPFFLYLAYTIPHSNIEIPEVNAAYAGEPWTDNQKKFASMITLLDRDAGLVADKLAELGLAQDTLIIFTSDNGPHAEGGHQVADFDSNGPLRGNKRSLNEGGIREPTLFYWPGTIAAGRVTDHLGYFPDVLPTFCELAQVPCPSGHDGVSLAPLLRQEPQPQHDHLYWEWTNQRAVRQGKWKAVVTAGQLSLYDLSQDLGETTDLAAQNPVIVAELQAIMDQEHADEPRVLTPP